MSQDVAVRVSSTVTFTCHTGNKKGACFLYQANISDEDKIDVCREVFDEKFIDRCNKTRQSTKGTVTLTISDVQLSDAGFYSCGDCHRTSAMTGLLVLGKNLISDNFHTP